ncbi:hypothetical protein DFJ73DRAFT_320206 [Zopfochytrium polystomum]|nr:hypothetical protein DFJ73DRAFT_320206 [Zopfochytrium polystomum]
MLTSRFAQLAVLLASAIAGVAAQSGSSSSSSTTASTAPSSSPGTTDSSTSTPSASSTPTESIPTGPSDLYAAFAALPQCGQTCLSAANVTLPSPPPEEIYAICLNIDSAVTAFNACVDTGCSADQATTCKAFSAQLPGGCKVLLDAVNSTNSSADSSSGSTVFSATATTTPGNAVTSPSVVTSTSSTAKASSNTLLSSSYRSVGSVSHACMVAVGFSWIAVLAILA